MASQGIRRRAEGGLSGSRLVVLSLTAFGAVLGREEAVEEGAVAGECDAEVFC
jgi:hypothetical protein